MKRFIVIISLLLVTSFIFSQDLKFSAGNRQFNNNYVEDSQIDKINIKNELFLPNILFVVVIFVLGVLINKNSEQFKYIFLALFDTKKISALVVQKNHYIDNLVIALNIVFFILLLLVPSVFLIDKLKLSDILTVWIIVIGFIMIKWLITKHIDLLQASFSKYYQKVVSIVNVYNLVILSFFLLLKFLPSQNFIFLSKNLIVLAVLLYFIGRYLLIMKFTNETFLKYYLILYFCTLEILPTFIFYKLLISKL